MRRLKTELLVAHNSLSGLGAALREQATPCPPSIPGAKVRTQDGSIVQTRKNSEV